MIKLFLIKKLSKHQKNVNMEKSAEILSPFIVISGVLIMLSYIVDMSLGDQINHGIVSSSYARIISSLGKLSKELIFPLVAIAIAYTVSGISAAIPALFGGVMSVSGYSFLNPEGGITSVCGVFGAILIGLISGYFSVAAKKIFSKSSQSQVSDFISVAAGVCFVALFSLSLNTLSSVSADSCSALLLFAESKWDFLPFLLLPYFINLNPGGASYITSYTFASAMLRSENAGVMASVFVSTVVPVISMGFYHLIFLRKNHSPLTFTSLAGLGFGIGGVHITPLLLYMVNPVRSVVSFTSGSLLSSVLCFLFDCEVRAYEGGFFAYELMNKPITLVAVTLSGALLSTLMLHLTERKYLNSSET